MPKKLPPQRRYKMRQKDVIAIERKLKLTSDFFSRKKKILF
ncbi:MAG: hypothetical protein AAB309_05760 [Deltaproteobacteria bacterium]